MIKIVRTKSEHKDFQKLVALLDEDLNVRNGIIQAQYNQYNNVASLNTVAIAYFDNKPVGCGCFKEFSDISIEIKRMFVASENRGRGIAKLILNELEKWAIELGFSKAILETGLKQTEAMRLYTKLGYTTIDNYGQYIGNSFSICMSKELNTSISTHS